MIAAISESHDGITESVGSAEVVMSLLAGIVVGGFGMFLLGLGGAILVKPASAERFLKSFASSARAHYTEQAFRLLVGASIVAFSPAMRHPDLFRLVGWLIVVTTVGLLLMPWRWHHRFAEWAIPLVLRHMRGYALGLLAFGGFLLYGAFYADPPAIIRQPPSATVPRASR